VEFASEAGIGLPAIATRAVVHLDGCPQHRQVSRRSRVGHDREYAAALRQRGVSSRVVASMSAGTHRVPGVTLTAADDVQNYGEVFTRRWVVDVLLELTGYTADRDLAALRLVEPSCGSGAFLGPAVERLIASAVTHGRDFVTLASATKPRDWACIICHI
jgi:hypothetical protein